MIVSDPSLEVMRPFPNLRGVENLEYSGHSYDAEEAQQAYPALVAWRIQDHNDPLNWKSCQDIHQQSAFDVLDEDFV